MSHSKNKMSQNTYVVDRLQVKVPSSDGVHQLSGVIYLPVEDGTLISSPKGFLHVVHGMTEYIGRYDEFMSRIAEQGWIVFGYDHLGHGGTVASADEYGFIAQNKGWDLLCRDVAAFSEDIRTRYDSERSLPYVLMGHSMGSFVVRLATELYVKPDKLIIMGTGGKNPLAGIGLVLAKLIKLFRGARHVSPTIDSLAFGSYNSRFSDYSPEYPEPWLSTDLETRKRYAADPLCRFKFTVSAMVDLITLNKKCNRPRWYSALSSDMPILLVSGKDDPVGNFGKGVSQVHEAMIDHDLNVQCKLYAKARHEILNDFTREQVIADIWEFLCFVPEDR